jgi:uncharacterized protein (DUF849 family)
MPLIKCCQNGDTTRDDHPAVPVTPDELARDGRACVAAGARALHFHPRDAEGLETLDAGPCAAAVDAVRAAVPGIPLGLSTAIGIVGGDVDRRLAALRSWTGLPDFVSLNLSEPGADDLAAVVLDELGIGVEAGVWTEEDAQALAVAPWRDRLVRVLIEVHDDQPDAAMARVDAIEAALDAAGTRAPRLHHGDGPVTWTVVQAALRRGCDVRVGLEDVTVLPDGTPVRDNAALIEAALTI